MIAQFEDQLVAVEELIKIATSLSLERDIKNLLDMILTSARKMTRAEAGRIYLLDRTKRHLYVEVSQNDVVEGRWHTPSPVDLFTGGKRHVANIYAYCAFSGKLVNVPHAYEYSGFDFRATYALDAAVGYRTDSVLVVPLRSHEGVTIGVLQLVNTRHAETQEVQPFPPEMEGVVTAFASQAAVAIDNAQLIHENRRLVELLERANKNLEQENQVLRQKIDAQYRFSRIVGAGIHMQQVFTLMRKVLDSDATVLLRGETGTGKELVAATIHYNSHRREGEFIAQNCAAMPEHLLESEFFGYRRGAFTGADTDKKGLIETANNGTLFLDEIGDMPLSMQSKLLRVLQEKEVRPLGSVKSVKVNVRVIAATHRDLQAMVAAGDFREDLYYRLCVFPIDIPPLRERREDLVALLNHFLGIFAEQYHKEVSGFSPEALDCLLRYDYPGNIRELNNIIERAMLLCDDGGSIDCEHLPGHLVPLSEANGHPTSPDQTQGSLPQMVRQFEASLIVQSLKAHDGNQTQTALALQVPRRTLIEKMNRYAIRK